MSGNKFNFSIKAGFRRVRCGHKSEIKASEIYCSLDCMLLIIRTHCKKSPYPPFIFAYRE